MRQRNCKSKRGKRTVWRSERRKWKKVKWSGRGGMEIDGKSETKSRTEWEASESERPVDYSRRYSACFYV